MPFAELGRVADSWSITEVHKGVKWDLGLGLHLIMRKAVFRIETAGTDDSWSSWVMIGHPF